ncbi:amidohydrolase family protein [Salsuginibacillus kocurii]|uniref:amidohydrolase family protein n=1 Tax=Salsuginibacillus kocurii TaxID=427078 RepID=UPI00036B538D|nr:amidohydrolase family protein [Salsuginibacillus kocurii]
MKIFDSHLHIIDKNFPIYENQGFLPNQFTVEDYQTETERNNINIAGGAIVSGSFQKFDQSYLIDSLQKLGKNFAGVTQLPHDTTDEEILRLNEYGVRAVRFNVQRGGSEDLSNLEYFAKRVYELAHWHVELYINSVHLKDLHSTLVDLPAVSIDHLGLSKEGLPHLLELVEKGGVRVKATGFGRIEFEDPLEPIKKIHSVHPHALMFGTDLPSTRAPRPFHKNDISIIQEALPKNDAEKILYKNAMQWYLHRDENND